jgi:hypothetical protein
MVALHGQEGSGLSPATRDSLRARGWRVGFDSAGYPDRIHAGEDLLIDSPGVTLPDDEYWDERFGIPSADGDIFALATDGDTLYVGGAFTHIGVSGYSHIAMWDGVNWQTLGSGVDGNIYAMAVSGEYLYVGGEFTAAGGIVARNIVRWNRRTQTWSAMGSGIAGNDFATVSAIAVSGNSIYVGGHFTTAGGVAASSLARWDASTGQWSAVGTGAGGVDGDVQAISIWQHRVHIGGSFSRAGNVDANNIALWNDSALTWSTFSWNQPGNGVKGHVNAIVAGPTGAIFGGEFDLRYHDPNYAGADTLRVMNIAMWMGRWTGGADVDDPNRTYGPVRAMTVGSDGIYVGGGFARVKPGEQYQLFGIPVNYVGQFVSGSWYPVGYGTNNGTDGYVNAVAVAGDNIYVGGSFRRAGKDTRGRIVRWNLTSHAWSPLYAGPNGSIFSLAAHDTDIYAGGIFNTSDGRTADHIARWSGSRWDVVKTTVDGPIYALSLSGDDIYVGGSFSIADQTSAINIARWNIATRQWSSLGDATGVGGGTLSFVSAVASRGKDVYVGGAFTIADRVSAYNIAHWDGTNWSALGDGINGTVTALAIADNGDLYAGGDFTEAGGIPADHVARWDGSRWSPLGKGVDDIVWVIAVNGEEVFFGGDFTLAGGDTARHIARWNRTAGIWLPLGGGITAGFAPSINSIVSSKGRIYVGGYFDAIGGVQASDIALWNGSAWGPLGSGLNNTARALAVTDAGLYVAGDFTIAGGKPSHHFAHWTRPLLLTQHAGVDRSDSDDPPLPGNSSYPFSTTTTIRFSLPPSTRSELVQLKIYDLLGNQISTLLDGEPAPGRQTVEWDASGYPPGVYYYRLVCGEHVEAGRIMVANW